MSTQPGTLTKMNQKQTVTYAQIEARLACLPLPDIDHVIGIANGGGRTGQAGG
ncbi:MAG: hypothetical protein QNJ45_13065 [Ardenticatenaceae bacterium]|nr:hypothetical protein [Ardenticatenaceae bacterium]